VGCNERKAGLDRVWVTYLKINFRLGPNAFWVGPGKILTFRPMQTFIHQLEKNTSAAGGPQIAYP
jgi:hypothetical protein